MIKIDKNIKIPEDILQRNKKCKYPFRFLQIGESFFVPKMNRINFHPQIIGAAKKYKVKFVFCECKEGKTKGIRVWRIK